MRWGVPVFHCVAGEQNGLVMSDQIKIFTCRANPALAGDVCRHLQLDLGKALVNRFQDGEVRVEITENVRGMDAYVIQSTCPPVNDNLVELLVMIDALKRASVRRVTAVIPYYGYGRRSQKEKPRVPISAKVVAGLLTVAGAQHVVAIDLHADQIEGFFDIPVDHLAGTEVLYEDLRGRLRGDEIIVAPDANGVPRARTFAKLLNVDLAIMDYRGGDAGGESRIVGRVEGRRVLILDDMVSTGRTLERVSLGAVAAGAESVEALCVHAVLRAESWRKIEALPLACITVTDTVPLPRELQGQDKMRVISIAPMLAEAIRCIHLDGSLASMLMSGFHG
ncbi:MAG: ribose-phosphate diphosphokinase [Syntrophobacteraceae bacterium]